MYKAGGLIEDYTSGQVYAREILDPDGDVICYVIEADGNLNNTEALLSFEQITGVNKMAKANFRIMVQTTLIDADGNTIAGKTSIGKFKPWVTADTAKEVSINFLNVSHSSAVDAIMDQESGDLDLDDI